MYLIFQSFVTMVSPDNVDRDERKVDPAIQYPFSKVQV